MNKQTPVNKPIYNLMPKDLEGFDSLAELALDMRWSWNHYADEVWRKLDPPLWDAFEANSLYGLLEDEIIPEFYARNRNGVSTAWVARMRESMACLTPQYSANRTVREYTEQHYLPAASAYSKRAEDKGAAGRQMVDWRMSLDQKWEAAVFGEVKVTSEEEKHLFEVQVYLNDLDENSARVELYADGVEGGEPVRQEMKHIRQLADAKWDIYGAQVPKKRPASDYTVRVVPYFTGVSVPLEAAQILWQH